MRHQQYLVVPFRPYGCQRRIDVGEIFRKAFAEKRILVRQDRAPVFPQIHRVKVVTMRIHAVSQLLLEEIVVITVDI